MGYMLDFPLTEMDVYGIRTNSGKKGMRTEITRIGRVGERIQNLLKGRKARLQGITEVNRTRQLAKDKRELTESKEHTKG